MRKFCASHFMPIFALKPQKQDNKVSKKNHKLASGHSTTIAKLAQLVEQRIRNA